MLLPKTHFNNDSLLDVILLNNVSGISKSRSTVNVVLPLALPKLGESKETFGEPKYKNSKIKHQTVVHVIH